MDLSDSSGGSHIGSDPFGVPESKRDPARRLRGQLAAPVTVWTAGGSRGERAGLTVSSVLVAEGEPPEVLGLVGDLTHFAELVRETRRFVVHVLPADQRKLADQFADRYPGDPFSVVAWEESGWGPVLTDSPVRGYCDLVGVQEVGWSLLLRAELRAVDIGAGKSEPLVHLRGRYVRISGRRPAGGAPLPPEPEGG